MGEIQEGRLIFAIENTRSAVILGFVMGACMVIGPVWAWWTEGVRTPGQWATMVVCCPMGIWFVVMAFRLWNSTGLTTWELDSDGITFQGPRGGRRSLLWRDVERVRWSTGRVRLLGREEQIDLNLKQLKPEGQPEAARALLHFLRPDFDLPTSTGQGRSWSDLWVANTKIAVCLLEVCVSAFMSGYLTFRLLAALIPAVAPFAGKLLLDKIVLNYVNLLFFIAIWIGLLSPFLVWARSKVWFDRRIH